MTGSTGKRMPRWMRNPCKSGATELANWRRDEAFAAGRMVIPFFCGAQESEMGAPGLSVHADWGASQLRQRAWRERDGRVTARLVAIERLDLACLVDGPHHRI